jgi:L-aminopeptidase/D-esterase-like protein
MGSLLDMPGLRIGHWNGAGTGCTVVLMPEGGAVAGIDVRGGAPASFDTELLRPGMLVQRVNALVLTGGSVFGLAACTGVTRWLAEQGAGFAFGGQVVPIMCGAAIFDLGVATDRPPDAEAGYAACQAALASDDSRGRVGAGSGATAGKTLGLEHAMFGGLGMASDRCGPHVVAAMAVVNAAGNVCDRAGNVIAGARQPDGSFANTIDLLREHGRLRTAGAAATGMMEHGVANVQVGDARSLDDSPTNTTLAIVATTARLTREGVTKLAQMAHDGLARAIRPAHTMVDGDLVFAISVPDGGTEEGDVSALGAIAAEALQDAVIDAATHANVPSGGRR